MAAQSKRPLTVEDALLKVLDGVIPIIEGREVDLLDAHGTMLLAPLAARHAQPPFDASAMDGYAVHAADVARLPVTLRCIGESAAGHGFGGSVEKGETVRIFTGAPMPAGTNAVVIQENAHADGFSITVHAGAPDRDHVRPRGGDFQPGGQVLAANQRLEARHLTLAAAAGHARLTVRRAPVVAILATGDELVMPGQSPKADQIVCSNPFGIAAMVTAAGGTPRLLGIARDTIASLEAKIALAADADVLVTLGGASAGDHDLVGPALALHGLELAFWKIAMRPGKPMMFGRLGKTRVLGLPGNPVSSLITARLFLVPLIHALLGRSLQEPPAILATLAAPIAANGPRTHYMRGVRELNVNGAVMVRALLDQDSSLLVPLAAADCLIVRPIDAVAAPAGTTVPILALDF